jgi:hypothetical protein
MWLASSAARDGCGERAILSVSGCSQASPATNYVGLSPSIGIFSCFKLQTLKPCSNMSIIKLYISKVISAPLAGIEMQVTQILLLLFRISFFFVYQHSDLEGSCSNGI